MWIDVACCFVSGPLGACKAWAEVPNYDFVARFECTHVITCYHMFSMFSMLFLWSRHVSNCFQLFPTVPTSQAEEKKSSEVLAARRAKGLAAHSGRKVGIP